MVRLKRFIFLFTACKIRAIATIEELDSALTILKDNDLYEQYTTRTSDGILVANEKSFQVASEICESLGETLWSPEKEDFSAGLNNTLSYQQYLKNFPSNQQFWIAAAGKACRTMDMKGKFRALNCHKRLPAICTQSAPNSNLTFSDKSPRFHIKRTVGKQSVTGYRDSNSWRFFGIRFSPKPQRFGYSSVYEPTYPSMAIEYPPQCLQLSGKTPVGSEDCLFLNIWSPYLPGNSIVKADLKPVFLFIYGGGFTTGTINDPGCDGGNFAARGDAVVVGLNYRLGNLGWLAIDDTNATGNYGLQDMITGLKWVKKYIEAFGGDPSRITIGGESSGAAAVRALIASESAKGLFHAGIIESQPVGINPNRWYAEYRSAAEYSALYGPPVLAATNCSTAIDKLACLRSVDANNLVTLPLQANSPVMDNKYLKTRNLPVTGKGYAAGVPIIMGTNRNELGVLGSQIYGFTNFTESLSLLSALTGSDLVPLAKSPAFPLSPGDPALSVFNATVRVISDAGVLCLTWATAYSAVKHEVLPAVYAFEFNRTYQPATFTNQWCSAPPTAEHPFGDPNLWYFKCHAGEVNFVFGVLTRLGLPDRDGLDIPFSQLVIDYWASFVWSHDPNPSTGYLKARGYYSTLNQINVSGKWEKVDTKNPELKRLQWNGAQAPFPEAAQCDALNYSLDYYETYL